VILVSIIVEVEAEESKNRSGKGRIAKEVDK